LTERNSNNILLLFFGCIQLVYRFYWLYPGGIILRPKESKKEIAYQKIKRLITDQDFAGNYSISENSLSKRLQMSRTPIREALQQLQTEGFIKVLPNRGIVVTETSVQEVRDIYDMRIALEEFVVRELSGNLTKEDIQYLSAVIDQQLSCILEMDTPGFLRSDREFHEFLFRRYGNPMIVEYMANLRDRLYSVNYKMLESLDNMKLFVKEHSLILTAMKEGDLERAIRQMDVHLKGAKTRLL